MRLTDPAGAADRARQIERGRPEKQKAGAGSEDQIASQSVEAAQGNVSRHNKSTSDRGNAAGKARRPIAEKSAHPQQEPQSESSEPSEHHILDARA